MIPTSAKNLTNSYKIDEDSSFRRSFGPKAFISVKNAM
jgi:hypothetical protein